MATGGHILELGCGTGWLGLELVQAGATGFVGQDFSEAQLELARTEVARSKLQGRVNFVRDLDEFCHRIFDLVLVHGFLHHLTQEEIRNVLLTARSLCKEDGRLIILEPIVVEPGRQSRSGGRLGEAIGRASLAALARMQWLANTGLRFGLRRLSEAELTMRAAIARRTWGQSPRGPSPKEMPFDEEEIEGLLQGAGFAIDFKKPVMFRSHLVMQEWLLRELSHPLSTRIVLGIVARLTRWMDHLVIATAAYRYQRGAWLFAMVVCRPA